MRQEWGADHGLELDAFNIGAVNVLKGPSSLLYGSDAMGGVIDVVPSAVPADNRVFGDVTLLGKSVNGTVGGSLMESGRMPGTPIFVIRNNISVTIVFRRILLST